MQVSGHGSNQVLLLILSGGYLPVAVKVVSSIFVNQLNATKLKLSKTQYHLKFELSLAQLSPQLVIFFFNMKCRFYIKPEKSYLNNVEKRVFN